MNVEKGVTDAMADLILRFRTLDSSRVRQHSVTGNSTAGYRLRLLYHNGAP
jgi:hypothetical protein